MEQLDSSCTYVLRGQVKKKKTKPGNVDGNFKKEKKTCWLKGCIQI